MLPSKINRPIDNQQFYLSQSALRTQRKKQHAVDTIHTGLLIWITFYPKGLGLFTFRPLTGKQKEELPLRTL